MFTRSPQMRKDLYFEIGVICSKNIFPRLCTKLLRTRQNIFAFPKFADNNEEAFDG